MFKWQIVNMMKWINERYEILGYLGLIADGFWNSQRFCFCICHAKENNLFTCYIALYLLCSPWQDLCLCITSVSWANGYMWKRETYVVLCSVMHLHKLTQIFYLTCFFFVSIYYCCIIYDFKEVDVKTKRGKKSLRSGKLSPEMD